MPFTLFGTGIENEPSNTELYREYRSKPKDMVRISPLVGMVGLKDEISNLNESNELFDCTTFDSFGIARSLIESKDIEHEEVELGEGDNLRSFNSR